MKEWKKETRKERKKERERNNTQLAFYSLYSRVIYSNDVPGDDESIFLTKWLYFMLWTEPLHYYHNRNSHPVFPWQQSWKNSFIDFISFSWTFICGG